MLQQEIIELARKRGVEVPDMKVCTYCSNLEIMFKLNYSNYNSKHSVIFVSQLWCLNSLTPDSIPQIRCEYAKIFSFFLHCCPSF